MPDRDILPSSLQESIITALCYADDNWGSLIAARVDPIYFEPPYLEICKRALDYRKAYKKAPGKAHIDDVFDFALLSKNERIASTYDRLLKGMMEQAPRLNTEYVCSRVTEFIRRQTLKTGVMKAADKWRNAQSQDDVSEEVEQILFETINTRLELDDPGTFFSDKQKILSYFDPDELSYCNIGIDELDDRGIYLIKSEMLLAIAPRKAGKTWLCVYCGRQALLQRWKVLHISLEVSEKILAKRYLQAALAASKRDEDVIKIDLTTTNDQYGSHIQFSKHKYKAELNFQQTDVKEQLSRHLTKLKRLFDNLLIKQFPSGSLTVAKLEAYLDSLAIVHKFIPDLIIVDYPDLMVIDPRNPVISLGRIFVDLRGLCQKRNAALLVPTQSTREGESASELQSHQVAGDISKVATADTVITLSRTKLEKSLGLARLYVSNARNEADGITVLITQNYATGQFKLGSHWMKSESEYWDQVKLFGGEQVADEND